MPTSSPEDSLKSLLWTLTRSARPQADMETDMAPITLAAVSVVDNMAVGRH